MPPPKHTSLLFLLQSQLAGCMTKASFVVMQLTGTGRIMRAVGRNILRDRVAYILLDLSGDECDLSCLERWS